jgi:hypothetical protein
MTKTLALLLSLTTLAFSFTSYSDEKRELHIVLNPVSELDLANSLALGVLGIVSASYIESSMDGLKPYQSPGLIVNLASTSSTSYGVATYNGYKFIKLIVEKYQDHMLREKVSKTLLAQARIALKRKELSKESALSYLSLELDMPDVSKTAELVLNIKRTADTYKLKKAKMDYEDFTEFYFNQAEFQYNDKSKAYIERLFLIFGLPVRS